MLYNNQAIDQEVSLSMRLGTPLFASVVFCALGKGIEKDK